MFVLVAAASPTTSTTQPGAVITIAPGGTAPPIVGPHNDSSDFYALAFALAGIIVAILVVRLAFRIRVHPSRLPEERRPGAPEDAEEDTGDPRS